MRDADQDTVISQSLKLLFHRLEDGQIGHRQPSIISDNVLSRLEKSGCGGVVLDLFDETFRLPETDWWPSREFLFAFVANTRAD